MISRSAVVQEMLNLFDQPSYLEIGVDYGQTFGALSATYKTAVDPDFKFTPPDNTANVEFYRATSDEYFASFCPVGKYFDVVYVDGLHIFEQVLRDLLNAALRLTRGGVIIIDDILPASYQSAMPLINEAFQVRDQLALDHPSLKNDNTWMGDVYKLAFFIETFMQQFSYATVQENHGQLIVWSSVRPVPALIPRNIHDVANLEFADTVLKRSVFQIRPIQDIVQEVRAAKDRMSGGINKKAAVNGTARSRR